jgi:hypothetical protein
MSDADARDELQRLIDSGVKLSRLRVLRVECEHNKALADVFAVNGRLVLDLRQTMSATIGDTDDEQAVWVRRGVGRSQWYLDAADDDTAAQASTSCCQRTFTAGWLRRQIDTGARRVVMRASDGSL